MPKAKTSAYPGSVRQRASHSLFVEGGSDSAFDVQVIQALLDAAGIDIEVRPLGHAHTMRCAAEALHKVHPDYYFLVDRDHLEDRLVEKCWSRFPDPRESNLLVWRRRELENYFMIPDYLSKSSHRKKGVKEVDLQEAILSSCQRRLYLDAANLTIISVREVLKRRWLDEFSGKECFETEAAALDALKQRPELAEFGKKAGSLLAGGSLERRLHEIVTELTDGNERLEYGCGRWLELVEGKPIFHLVVNRFFEVRDNKGRFVQGDEKMAQVAKGLVRLPLSEQPDDFQQLERLIRKNVFSG